VGPHQDSAFASASKQGVTIPHLLAVHNLPAPGDYVAKRTMACAPSLTGPDNQHCSLARLGVLRPVCAQQCSNLLPHMIRRLLHCLQGCEACGVAQVSRPELIDQLHGGFAHLSNLDFQVCHSSLPFTQKLLLLGSPPGSICPIVEQLPFSRPLCSVLTNLVTPHTALSFRRQHGCG
jgi:hypothetical protein